MKIAEPIGDAAWGAFVLRSALGFFLMLKGMNELEHLPVAIGLPIEVPSHVRTLIGILLPYLEILAGGLLVIGFWTTLAAVLASVVVFAFVYGVGFFPKNGQLFNKDLILLAASVSLLYTGAGAFSVDRFRKSA